MKIFFSSLLLLSFSIAYACSCMPPNSIRSEFAYADAVVLGTVTSKTYCSFAETINPEKINDLEYLLDEKQCDLLYRPMLQQVVVEIESTFKNPSQSNTVIINTPRGGASCGFYFNEGERYLVYANKKSIPLSLFIAPVNTIKDIYINNHYWTNQCQRTCLYPEKEEIDSLFLLKK